jgi:hypothetical protein
MGFTWAQIEAAIAARSAYLATWAELHVEEMPQREKSQTGGGGHRNAGGFHEADGAGAFHESGAISVEEWPSVRPQYTIRDAWALEEKDAECGSA